MITANKIAREFIAEQVARAEESYRRESDRREAAANRAMLEIQELFRRPFVDTRNIIEIVERNLGV